MTKKQERYRNCPVGIFFSPAHERNGFYIPDGVMCHVEKHCIELSRRIDRIACISLCNIIMIDHCIPLNIKRL